MYHNRTTYYRSFRVSLTVLLTVLIGFGVMIPQVAAQLGCLHACCSMPAASHMQHDTVRISGPSQPSCCGPVSSDACQLCKYEEMPLVELAFQTAQCQYNHSTTIVSAIQRNPSPNAALQSAGGSAAAVAQRSSPPLYLQTLSLLI